MLELAMNIVQKLQGQNKDAVYSSFAVCCPTTKK